MISGRETETLPIQIFSNMPAAIAAASSKNAAKIFLFFRTALSAEFFPILCYPFCCLSLLLQPVQIPGLFVIARQHPVKILDQISGRHGLLIHILCRTPDLMIFYCLKIL